jgi:hypothetical protein
MVELSHSLVHATLLAISARPWSSCALCYALTTQSPEFAMQRRNHYSEQPQPYRSSLCGISSHLNDKLEADTHEHDAQPPSAVIDARLERTRRPFGASRKLYFAKARFRIRPRGLRVRCIRPLERALEMPSSRRTLLSSRENTGLGGCRLLSRLGKQRFRR